MEIFFFVHIYIGKKAYQVGEKLVNIPQEIFKRMLSYTNISILSNNFTHGGGGFVGITCSDEGNLIVMGKVNSELQYYSRYLYASYVLKDI